MWYSSSLTDQSWASKWIPLCNLHIRVGRMRSSLAFDCQCTSCNGPVPKIIDPVFAKTSQNARFLLSENERFGLVFVKTGSINSGTGFDPIIRRHSGIWGAVDEAVLKYEKKIPQKSTNARAVSLFLHTGPLSLKFYKKLLVPARIFPWILLTYLWDWTCIIWPNISV